MTGSRIEVFVLDIEAIKLLQAELRLKQYFLNGLFKNSKPHVRDNKKIAELSEEITKLHSAIKSKLY